MPTVSEIISIAKVSEYLASVDIYKSGINFGGNDVGLPRKLYCIRKNVEKVFDLDPTDDTLTQTSNYLFSLCNRYAFKAQSILNIASGGTIAPVTPSGGDIFPIVVTGADFEMDGITYDNPDIVNNNLMLFVAGFNQEWQFAPAFFSYTATGIQIVFPGFDANNYTHIIIQNYNP